MSWGTSRESVGWPKTTTLLTRSPKLAAPEQLAVRHHQIRTEMRARRDLREQRCPELARHLLGTRPRPGARDDDGAG